MNDSPKKQEQYSVLFSLLFVAGVYVYILIKVIFL